MRVPMARCRTRVAALCFTGSGVLFFLFLLQTMFGRYADKAVDAWGWLAPHIVPTLSLMLGVLAAQKGVETQTVDRFFFRSSFLLSFVYLLAVLLINLLLPFVAVTPQESLEVLKQANLGLGISQGLVSASIGAFFVHKEKS